MSFHYKPLFFSGLILFFVAVSIAIFSVWDNSLSHYFILSPSNHFIPLVKFISKIGSFIIITPLTLIVGVWLWIKKRVYEAMWAIATMASCRIIFSALKLFVGRERPVFDEPLTHAISYSFPSGHSINSLVFVLVCYFIFYQKKSILLISIIGVLFIGWSRLALGAHWFSDVLAGWGCGLMWISIMYQAKISKPLQHFINKKLYNN